MNRNLKLAARAGNPKAIEQLIEKMLRSQNITVQVVRTDAKLIILLSAEAIPSRCLVHIITKGLDKIRPQGIRTVTVRAQSVFSTRIAWTKQWYLDSASIQHQSTTSATAGASTSSVELFGHNVPAHHSSVINHITFHNQTAVTPTTNSIWRFDNLLIMRRDAQLPDHCIKTNQPAHGQRYKVELRWLPWWILLLRIFSYLLSRRKFPLVSVLFSCETVTIYVGMTAIQMRKLRRQRLWGWSMGALGLSLFLTPLILSIDRYPAWVGWIMGLGVLLLVIGPIIGEVANNPVEAVWIKGDLICLRGFSRAYLKCFPDWELSD